MLVVQSRQHKTDEQLIERHVDSGWDRYPGGLADARLRDSGVPIWALIGHLRVIGQDTAQLARDYEISAEAVAAALAFYRHHKRVIDARLVLNEA
ncbi:MAG: DUF433 domain-containing protein [Chloroflexi bacterium]|nr:DUF433 domain-containing protein [Chloroflexota bacterium]